MSYLTDFRFTKAEWDIRMTNYAISHEQECCYTEYHQG